MTRESDRHASIRRHFTLLEVVIAALILALSVACTVSIVGAARGRILRAERRWGREHLLAQAAEFYLLAGPRAMPPRSLLPEGFSSDCELVAADDVPDAALEPEQGWVLGEFHVRVFDTNGEVMASCVVQKIVREEEDL